MHSSAVLISHLLLATSASYNAYNAIQTTQDMFVKSLLDFRTRIQGAGESQLAEEIVLFEGHSPPGAASIHKL
jgi:hypothetical protein